MTGAALSHPSQYMYMHGSLPEVCCRRLRGACTRVRRVAWGGSSAPVPCCPVSVLLARWRGVVEHWRHPPALFCSTVYIATVLHRLSWRLVPCARAVVRGGVRGSRTVNVLTRLPSVAVCGDCACLAVSSQIVRPTRTIYKVRNARAGQERLTRLDRLPPVGASEDPVV